MLEEVGLSYNVHKIDEFQGLTLENHPNLKRWVEKLQDAPAVQRGMKVP